MELRPIFGREVDCFFLLRKNQDKPVALNEHLLKESNTTVLTQKWL